MADRKISELVALTTPAAGDYLPIIDISEAAAVSKNKRITIEELLRGAPDGTAAAPSIAFESDGGNGLYLAATDTIGISTNGVSRATISTTAITSALPIALSGSTSGSVTLTPVAVAGTTTITLPATTGTVITTGDSGTVTSTMIADGAIVNADINASAAIAGTKISPNFGSQTITTTGVVSAALGAAATPSLTFTGDLNTGIYSPGADQVAISTNGTGRLFINSAGDIGIGLASPSYDLHLEKDENALTTSYFRNINTGSSAGSRLIAASLVGNLTFTAYSAAHSVWPATTVINSDSGFTGGMAINAAGANPLRLFTDSTERLRITSAGLVGVGTSSPAGRLHVFGGDSIFGATSYTRILNADRVIDFTNTAQDTYVAGRINGLSLKIYGNNGNGIDIDSLGRVGIGTSSPSFTAHVSGAKNTSQLFIDAPTISAANDFAQIGFGIGGTAFGLVRLGFDNPAGVTNSYLSFYNNSGSSTVERMRIDSSGRVGIGTTSPGSPLQVNGTGGIKVNEDGAGTNEIQLRSNWAGVGPAINVQTNQSLIFTTNATERARIDTSGRWLLGTSTARGNFFNTTVAAQQQLEGTTLAGSISSIVRTDASAGAGYLALAKSRGASIGANTIVQDADGLGGITFQGNDGTEFVEAARILAEVDGTPGANDMPGRLVLSVTADGASSPTEALRITNDRVICYNQPAPASYAAAATLTVADLKTGIIQYTGAAATLTLPTGTLTEAGFSGVYTNMTFQWSLINTGSGLVTIGAGTDHTIVGLATCAQNNSARFATRRTAANTFVSYRIA